MFRFSSLLLFKTVSSHLFVVKNLILIYRRHPNGSSINVLCMLRWLNDKWACLETSRLFVWNREASDSAAIKALSFKPVGLGLNASGVCVCRMYPEGVDIRSYVPDVTGAEVKQGTDLHTHLSMYSLTHSLTHSLTQLLTHSWFTCLHK